MRQIFLDTETTGLNPAQGDRVLELGCIEYIDRRPSGRTLHHYINPERSSHPDALRVHGITDDFLADKPLFAQVAQDFVAFIEGAELIAHNAAFDVGFLDAELKRLSLPPVAKHAQAITDSLLLARQQFPGKANSLDALCKRLEVDNSNRDLHGALLDAGLLAEVYVRLTRGQGSLVIDAGETARAADAAPALDLSTLPLPRPKASESERQAHELLLSDVDKASKGRLVWRSDLPAAEAARTAS